MRCKDAIFGKELDHGKVRPHGQPVWENVGPTECIHSSERVSLDSVNVENDLCERRYYYVGTNSCTLHRWRAQ
jgi:hypothetical protein